MDDYLKFNKYLWIKQAQIIVNIYINIDHVSEYYKFKGTKGNLKNQGCQYYFLKMPPDGYLQLVFSGVGGGRVFLINCASRIHQEKFSEAIFLEFSENITKVAPKYSKI